MSLIDVLRQRAQNSPDHSLFTQINVRGTEVDSITCTQLLRKAERIGALLVDKGRMNPGEHVALIFPPGIDLIAAFYGCQAAGTNLVTEFCIQEELILSIGLAILVDYESVTVLYFCRYDTRLYPSSSSSKFANDFTNSSYDSRCVESRSSSFNVFCYKTAEV